MLRHLQVFASRSQRLRFIPLERDAQRFLLFTTIQRENPMRRHLADRLGVIEVVAKFGMSLLGGLRRQRGDSPRLLGDVATALTQVGVIRNPFGKNVGRSGECRRCVEDFQVWLDERNGRLIQTGLRQRLIPNRLGQWFETTLLRNRRARTSLRTERQVEIIEPLHRVGAFDLGSQFGSQLSLTVDHPENVRRPLGQLPQQLDSLFDRANLFFVQVARALFAIARDERNGVALVEQQHRLLDLFQPQMQLRRNASEVDFGWKGWLGHRHGSAAK